MVGSPPPNTVTPTRANRLVTAESRGRTIGARVAGLDGFAGETEGRGGLEQALVVGPNLAEAGALGRGQMDRVSGAEIYNITSDVLPECVRYPPHASFWR